jgi:hypothetical protein
VLSDRPEMGGYWPSSDWIDRRAWRRAGGVPSGVVRGVARGVPEMGDSVGWNGATYVEGAGLIGAESIVIGGNGPSESSAVR